MERVGSAVALIAEKMDVMLFNRVIGLGVLELATEAMVDDMVVLYRLAGLQNLAVQISPAAQPSALPAWLEVRSLSRRDNWTKVYPGAEPPPVIPTDLRIEAIGPERATTFAEVVCAAFGMPDSLTPWFAAPVGLPGRRHPGRHCRAACQDQVGWLGWAGTLSAYRRRGAQGALMAQRIRDGLDSGCRWLITETGEDSPSRPNPSYHNMVRTGFELAYQRPNYIFRASSAS